MLRCSRIKNDESGIHFGGCARPAMRQTRSLLLILLACVVSAQCGGSSDPTSPSTQSSPVTAGGSPGGGSGGSSGGGTETVRATTPIVDNSFDDNDWDEVVETYGATGSGSAGHLSFNGQAGADYRQINIHITGGGSGAQLALFAIRRDVLYFPTSDGEILYVDYSESSINQAGGVQYSAPAIRQNGKLYTLIPGSGAFTTPDASWTDHSLAHLTASDFRTIASATDHPDFKNGRIEFGFMRLQVGQGDTRAGIDNYRLVLYRK